MIFLGDVHSRFNDLRTILDRYSFKSQLIVQVGDFGVGFRRPTEEQAVITALDRFLGEQGNKMYAIRGNHDNPSYFGPRCPVKLNNITLVEDYSTITLEGKKLFLVGGAISVDRRVRVEGVTYWKNEGFEIDLEKLQRLDLSNLWAVVTHTAPAFVEPLLPGPLSLQYAKDDPSLFQELRAEREAMTMLHKEIMRHATPKYWFYGHFHFHAHQEVKGTRFVLLDELELHNVYLESST